MTPYKNLSGKSGVRAYSLASDSITVSFAGGATYVYTADSAGRSHIARMRRLALSGRGLSSYIARHVRDRYAARLD